MSELRDKLLDWADKHPGTIDHFHGCREMLDLLWPVIEAAQVATLPRNNELIQALADLEEKLK